MKEKIEKVLDKMGAVLPKASTHAQDYLLGFGDGMAAMMDDKERAEVSREQEEKRA